MLLTITTTHTPATDLGYLLHKNPGRVQSFDLTFGKAHVFYPAVSQGRCTAALLLDVDPVGLVRNHRGPSGEGHALEQYVNDRPYVASSFMSVAISQVLGTALGGRCKERPELAQTPLPLEARLAVLPCSGGEAFLRKLFEPLGYEIAATPAMLDTHYPQWGASRYFTVSLRGELTLSQLLSHLYVLIPVMDDDKHYWVDQAEVDKLLRHGEGWLNAHPERDAIVSRYLRRQRQLTRIALARLLEEDQADTDEQGEVHAIEEAAIEEKISLNDQRLGAVLAALKSSSAKRVMDLGCGEGKLLRLLLAEHGFDEILGMDVSHRALEVAQDKLRLDRLPEMQRKRITLIQGSLSYRDKRLEGFDAAAVVEVIEHLDSSRLGALERVLFEFARPDTIVLTTPNVEYNVRFANLPTGKLRHRDHRFEWSRQQFADWACLVCARFGYQVRFVPVGPVDPEVGAPTQMGVFTRG